LTQAMDPPRARLGNLYEPASAKNGVTATPRAEASPSASPAPSSSAGGRASIA